MSQVISSINGILLLFLWLACQAAQAAPLDRTAYYDEENGLPHGHVTQLLQDDRGFIWIATWNGLCRFDGYDFITVKPSAGDGCHMTTDRFRDIALRPDGLMVCRVDEDYYFFDTRSYRFRDMTPEEARKAPDELMRYRQSRYDDRFALTDRQGNRWMVADKGICRVTSCEQRTERLDISPAAEVKCLFADRQQRYWVTTKADGAVRVYDGHNDRLLGYLAPDGALHTQYTRFGAAVYSMFQTTDGALWLGTKPEGLFRLRETSPHKFKVDHFTELPNPNVYAMTEDGFGRLWIATLGGGLCYTSEPGAETPRFRVPKGYPADSGQRLHFLHLTRQGSVLMVAATDGLFMAAVEKDADNMHFRHHQRENDRATSLSSSATMDIAEDSQGRLYVSTESGGYNRIESDNLLADTLTFRHYTAGNHSLPNDVVMSLTPLAHDGLLAVSPHLITLLDSAGRQRVLDARYFLADYRLSEAHPLRLSGGRWLFALTDGAFITSTQLMYHEGYKPPLVLTGVSIQGGADTWTVPDTIMLEPDERNVTIRFAALDYNAPERISYAFRLLPQSHWNHIGHDRSATLLDVAPGTYRLEVRSTDAEGQWLDNVRSLVIIVKPTFWEAWYGQLLMVLIIAAVIATIAYTLLYIRRIKRKQRETLEKYLSLIEESSRYEVRGTRCEDSTRYEDDPMLKRVMTFIEENIANGDASVGDMAAAAATSRSGLQRKLKQTMGITPQDLLREARIKHACQLLRTTDKTVAEVAYACGFTDPKYFSRSFKQSVGQTPSEFKNKA